MSVSDDKQSEIIETFYSMSIYLITSIYLIMTFFISIS